MEISESKTFITERAFVQKVPFSQLAQLIKFSENEDDNKYGADNGCDGDAVVPLFKSVDDIGRPNVLQNNILPL